MAKLDLGGYKKWTAKKIGMQLNGLLHGANCPEGHEATKCGHKVKKTESKPNETKCNTRVRTKRSKRMESDREIMRLPEERQTNKDVFFQFSACCAFVRYANVPHDCESGHKGH